MAVLQHWEQVHHGFHRLLHHVWSTQRRAQSLFPSGLVYLRAADRLLVGAVVVRMKHQLLAMVQNEVRKIDGFVAKLSFGFVDYPSPGHKLADGFAFGSREMRRNFFVG